MSSLRVDLTAIGQRIERLRGTLSQADFAATLDVDRKTVGTWERGERLPDTRALLGLWGQYDADPAWVLTGQGFAPELADDERELLSLFRRAPLAVKMAAVGALQGAAAAPGAPRTVRQVNSGNNNVQVGHIGTVHHAPPPPRRRKP